MGRVFGLALPLYMFSVHLIREGAKKPDGQPWGRIRAVAPFVSAALAAADALLV